MNRAAHAAAAAVTAVLLAGCSNATSTPKAAPGGQAAPAPAPSQAAADANSAFAAISAAVPSAKLGGTVTAENDPNHMLGRPNGYTSKITFTDARIPAEQTEGRDADDLELGGSIEVFPTAAEAKARADYIQAATKAMPALVEYDYLHGATLVRVSRLLTPAQAADYEKAATKLP
ncbi:hypothetical protein [Streptomyces sp. KS 21]|uniref:hypothetical protein n=1 Tax=Streptomyces sp. KS 21 TaxID=2485150 RepID=UPI0010640D4A|nr:hypothetical protein [Streptomyces sp. KS 21]TDU73495.1 hypothetical protein EDD91_0039 [Streptomyces sp. KS 21]